MRAAHCCLPSAAAAPASSHSLELVLFPSPLSAPLPLLAAAWPAQNPSESPALPRSSRRGAAPSLYGGAPSARVPQQRTPRAAVRPVRSSAHPAPRLLMRSCRLSYFLVFCSGFGLLLSLATQLPEQEGAKGMGSSGCSEIVEVVDDPKDARLGGVTHLRVRVKPVGQEHGARSCSVEDDLDRLIRSINVRTSARASGQTSTDRRLIALGKSPMSSEIVESVSLKQALRKMCISQASEMAAMKRLSKPSGVSTPPDSGAIKKLYGSIAVQTNEEKDDTNKVVKVFCVA
ncbi:hypothetical protein HU200_005417 [Digitaria exilis]|uniref:Uncharacterized protein n=1 Tax=Digitaria exilis TaxID=1010633 RepID=A0A835FT59_9POAL|nr:hypothetical protein HU200_005417 [Digitaria exilis]